MAEVDASPRAEAIARAARVLGDALGTILAHESAHALGLVPGGRPPVGLFGGSDEASEQYAHNLDTEGRPPSAPWLMNAGGRFEFETIVPSNYGPAPHIHFRITADGFRERRTDMYFRDDKHPEGGPPELTPKLVEQVAKNGETYFEARFDVTIEPDS